MATRCDGCPYSGRAVGTRGPQDASFIVVGEAPGADELVKGRPLTGPSGHLLWKTLKACGLENPEETVFATNAMRCRPTDTPPKAAAIDACHGRMMEEVDAPQRKVILAMGNSALRSLTGNHKLKMTNEHGKAFALDGAIVVPTWHPAAVLRQNDLHKQMQADMQYAVNLYLGKQEVRDAGETKFLLIDEVDKAHRIVRALVETADESEEPFVVAADIETGSLNPYSGYVLCIGICYEKNKVFIFNEDTFTTLFPLFEHTNVKWVWHNGKFDTGFLHQHDMPARVDEDVMLIHYALDEVRGTHDLEQLAALFLGADDYKGVVKRYVRKGDGGYENVPRRVLYPYLAKDCDYTYQLYHLLRPRLDDQPKLTALYRSVLLKASAYLQKVESRGVLVDRNNLEALRKALTERKEQQLAVVAEHALPYWDAFRYVADTGAKKVPEEFSPSSPKQLGWLLYQRLQLHKKAKQRIPIERGKIWPSTNKEILAMLPRTPLVAAIIQLRDIEKSLGTYVEGVDERIHPDGRTHSTFLIHRTVTGRLASRNPNMQNIPRRPIIRNIFTARPGYCLLELDYNQAELRVLACLARDEFLAQCYRDGRSLHKEVARARYGEAYTPDQLIRAKAVNFGIAYGRKAASIAAEYGVTIAEAEEDIQAWFRRMPQAAKFLLGCDAAAAAGRTLISHFGRRRRIGYVNENGLAAAQNEARNFPLQSTASDLTLLSAIAMDDDILALGAQAINLIHDAIMFEVPANVQTIRKVIEIGTRYMVDMPRRAGLNFVPFVAEAKAGLHWGDLKEFHSDEELEVLIGLRERTTA